MLCGIAGGDCDFDDDAQSEEDEKEEKKEEEEVVEAAPAEMRAIIMKQKASGSWSLSDVASLLGSLSAEKIKKILSSLIQGDCSGDVENLWITAVVVAFLQVYLLLPLFSFISSSLSDSPLFSSQVKWPRQKTNWGLVVGKGQRWVGKQSKSVVVKPEGFDFLQQAMDWVKQSI